MPDCTRSSPKPPPWRFARRLALAMVIAALWPPTAALADGDPASDVLVGQPLFVPQDAGVSSARQMQLAALVQAATRRGYKIRVALIASPTDLGSVTALWRRPHSYAKFLGQELALVYRGPLLVVMPQGVGVYDTAGSGSSGESVRAATSSRGGGLAATALIAVQRLAGAAGQRLAIPETGETTGRGSTDPLPAIVFVAGCLVIALAWVASFRARPPTRKRGLPRGAADPL